MRPSFLMHARTWRSFGAFAPALGLVLFPLGTRAAEPASAPPGETPHEAAPEQSASLEVAPTFLLAPEVAYGSRHQADTARYESDGAASYLSLGEKAGFSYGGRLELGAHLQFARWALRLFAGGSVRQALTQRGDTQMDGITYSWRSHPTAVSFYPGVEFRLLQGHLGIGPTLGVVLNYPHAVGTSPPGLFFENETDVQAELRLSANYYGTITPHLNWGLGLSGQLGLGGAWDYGVAARTLLEWSPPAGLWKTQSEKIGRRR